MAPGARRSLPRRSVARGVAALVLLAGSALWGLAPARAQEDGRPAADPTEERAQPAPEVPGPELVVAVTPFSPFVMGEGAELEGFDVELWRAVADDLNLSYRFESKPSLKALVAAVKAGEVDAALAGITINRDREATLDFSHQYIQSGLQILVPVDARGNPLSVAWSVLSSPKVLTLLGSGAAFILVSALLCWWSERGKEAFDDRFFPGIFEAIYWTIVTMSTVGYGDYAPKRWLGRCVAVFVIFTGISIYGTLIAEGASTLTAARLQSEIRAPEDLRGLAVATVRESTSVPTLQAYGARVVEVERIDEAYALLGRQEVRAVVYDAPSLKHHVMGAGAGKVELAGESFDHQYYGVAFPEGSQLRERVNRSLLKLRSNGVYEKLYARWFGAR